MSNNNAASSIEKLSRKVNRPRLTLRKNERVLNNKYRGVVPALLSFGADLKEFETYSPETILQIVGMFMSARYTWQILKKPQLTKLRQYLRKQGIADYTQEKTDEEAARSATTCKARGRKSSGRK